MPIARRRSRVRGGFAQLGEQAVGVGAAIVLVAVGTLAIGLVI